MKSIFLTIVYFLFFCSTNLFSQSESIFESAEKSEINSFFDSDVTELKGKEIRVLLHLNYGTSTIKNIHDVTRLYLGEVKRINLFYSDYPKGKNLDGLNKKRIEHFLTNYGSKLSSSVEWQLIKQTSCDTKSDAYQLFHGFEVIIEFTDDYNLTDVNLDTSFTDFVVEEVLKRNDWHEMLIVSDFTGSMSPYIAQLFLWLKLNTIDDRIKQFVFFNDGDSKLDESKVIGQTGGVYQTKSMEYDEIERVAVQCMLSGYGGDQEENDLEALLRGIKLCPDCKENVLIVDNDSSVRDLVLLEEIKEPIRIIICGAVSGINIEYLNLARKTNGSIHLIEKDIFNLMEINEGEEISIGDIWYTIKNNKFEVIKKI